MGNISQYLTTAQQQKNQNQNFVMSLTCWVILEVLFKSEVIHWSNNFVQQFTSLVEFGGTMDMVFITEIIE